MKFILAKKLGMTTIYMDGVARNVTLLHAGKNVITQIRNQEKDNYTAIQVGMLDDRSTDEKKRYTQINEMKVENIEGYNVNDELKVDQFSVDEKVKVIGTSKGKGFQGVVKRHGFHGAPASHGHRHDHRAPGSIGSGFPERVFPGKRMAGRMGGNQVTTKGIKIAFIDGEKKLVAIEGAIPGNNGSIVRIIAND